MVPSWGPSSREACLIILLGLLLLWWCAVSGWQGGSASTLYPCGVSGGPSPSSAYTFGADDGPTRFGGPSSALSASGQRGQGGLLGKAVMYNFSPSARSRKNGPGPGTHPYWELRVLTVCAGLVTLPCFRLSLYSGFCFRASVSGPLFRPAPSLLYLRLHRRWQGPSIQHQKGCVPSHRPLRLRMDPLATRDKALQGTGSWALSRLSVRQSGTTWACGAVVCSQWPYALAFSMGSTSLPFSSGPAGGPTALASQWNSNAMLHTFLCGSRCLQFLSFSGISWSTGLLLQHSPLQALITVGPTSAGLTFYLALLC